MLLATAAGGPGGLHTLGPLLILLGVVVGPLLLLSRLMGGTELLSAAKAVFVQSDEDDTDSISTDPDSESESGPAETVRENVRGMPIMNLSHLRSSATTNEH